MAEDDRYGSSSRGDRSFGSGDISRDSGKIDRDIGLVRDERERDRDRDRHRDDRDRNRDDRDRFRDERDRHRDYSRASDPKGYSRRDDSRERHRKRSRSNKRHYDRDGRRDRSRNRNTEEDRGSKRERGDSRQRSAPSEVKPQTDVAEAADQNASLEAADDEPEEPIVTEVSEAEVKTLATKMGIDVDALQKAISNAKEHGVSSDFVAEAENTLRIIEQKTIEQKTEELKAQRQKEKEEKIRAQQEAQQARKRGWDAEVAKASERASGSAELAKARKRRSGWDALTPDPQAAVPLPSHMSASSSEPPNTNVELLKSGSALQTGGHGPYLANFGIPVFQIELDQSCVARVVGKAGESIRQIEKETGAIVKLDHGLKAQGKAICRIYGQSYSAEKAADLVRLRIASVRPMKKEELPVGMITEIFHCDPRLIGLILGRGGDGLKRIQDESGASICFVKQEDRLDYAGRAYGDSFHLVGRPENVAKARNLLETRLEQSTQVTFGVPEGSDPSALIRPGDIVQELPVEQNHVGRIIGKGKSIMQPVIDQTGCRVQLDQTTKDKGYSIVRIIGSKEGTEKAYEMLARQVERAQRGSCDLAGDWVCPKCGDAQFARNKTCRRCCTEQPADVAAMNAARDRMADDELRIEQKYVGYIIGPQGSTLKQIKEQSGARVFVDQETRDQGFSIVRIGQPGSPQNQLATQLIQQRLAECMNLHSSRAGVAPGGPAPQQPASQIVLHPPTPPPPVQISIVPQEGQEQGSWEGDTNSLGSSESLMAPSVSTADWQAQGDVQQAGPAQPTWLRESQWNGDVHAQADWRTQGGWDNGDGDWQANGGGQNGAAQWQQSSEDWQGNDWQQAWSWQTSPTDRWQDASHGDWQGFDQKMHSQALGGAAENGIMTCVYNQL